MTAKHVDCLADRCRRTLVGGPACTGGCALLSQDDPAGILRECLSVWYARDCAPAPREVDDASVVSFLEIAGTAPDLVNELVREALTESEQPLDFAPLVAALVAGVHARAGLAVRTILFPYLRELLTRHAAEVARRAPIGYACDAASSAEDDA